VLLGVEQGVWREVEEVRVGDAGGEGFFLVGVCVVPGSSGPLATAAAAASAAPLRVSD